MSFYPCLDPVGGEGGPLPLLGHVINLVEPAVVLDLLQRGALPEKPSEKRLVGWLAQKLFRKPTNENRKVGDGNKKSFANVSMIRGKRKSASGLFQTKIAKHIT